MLYTPGLPLQLAQLRQHRVKGGNPHRRPDQSCDQIIQGDYHNL